MTASIALLKEIDPGLEPPTAEDIKKKYKKVTEAITSFKTTADKFLRVIGVSFGFFAGLAAGLTTGVCIFLLV